MNSLPNEEHHSGILASLLILALGAVFAELQGAFITPDQYQNSAACDQPKLGSAIGGEQPLMGKGENLIFLISQPRAGSTLLQKILGSHPQIHTVSEPWISLHPLFSLRERGINAVYDFDLSRRALKGFLGTLPEGDEAYWEAVRRMLNHLYGRSLAEARKGLFLDKTPRYYFVIRELRRVFPLARFVFLLRNPLAVFSSILKNWVRDENIWQLRRLRHDLLDGPSLLLEGIGSFGQEAIVVHYETVVSEPVAAIQRLASQLGIAFDPRMVELSDAIGDERWQFGDQDTVYREPRPSPEYAERWRTDLEGSPVWGAWARSYLDALGPELIRNLGYDYAQLSADIRAPAASKDWEVVEADAGEEGLRRLTAVIADREARVAEFESVAEERLRDLKSMHVNFSALQKEADARERGLHELTAVIADRDARIAELKGIAEERLQGLEAMHVNFSALQKEADARERGLRELTAVIAQREARVTELEAVAEERLRSMEAMQVNFSALEKEADVRERKLRDLTAFISEGVGDP